VPIESLAEGLRVAFGGVEERLAARWIAEPARARSAAKALLSLARDGCHRLLDWSAVARAAHGLAAHLPDGEHRFMAELAAHIADRHGDAPSPLALRRDWLANQPRPFRLKLWAHLVQSAADGVDAWRALLGAAEEEVAPPSHQHAEDLELAGALGRAHAAWYAHEAATRWLEHAIEGWIALERPHDASYAVAELLRVAGAEGDAALVERVERYAALVLEEPRTSEVARAFVCLAMGRARALIGDPRGALEALDDRAARWSAARVHAGAARWRWRAEALSELGREELAEAIRRELDDDRRGAEASAIARLAEVDRALRSGEHEAALRKAEAHPLLSRELTRLRAHFRPAESAEILALLRRHSRY
jgi:hypothetical protein